MFNRSENFNASLQKMTMNLSNQHRMSSDVRQYSRPKPVFIWKLTIDKQNHENNKGKIAFQQYKRNHIKIIHRCSVNLDHPWSSRRFPVLEKSRPFPVPRLRLLRHLHVNIDSIKDKDSGYILRFLISLKGISSLTTLSWEYKYGTSHANLESNFSLKCVHSSIKHFKELSKISSISPHNASATDKTIKVLFSSFKYSNHLSVLALILDDCSNVHSRQLARQILSLRHHKCLSNLDLSLFYCNSYGRSFEALKYLTSLNTLSLKLLYGVKLDDQSMDILSESLKSLTRLSTLDLKFGYCRISDFGIKTLCVELKALKSLSNLSLELSYCQNISYLGIRGICISVCEYTSLSAFKLEFSEVEKINRVGNLMSVLEESHSLSKVTINKDEFDLRKRYRKRLPGKQEFYQYYPYSG